jgi:hypothetical protein
MELEGEQRKGRDISFAGFHRCWEESFPKIPLDLLANAILGLVQLEILQSYLSKPFYLRRVASEANSKLLLI